MAVVVGRVRRCAQVVYGVNTGFGSFQNVSLPADKLGELQVNLILSHSAGGLPGATTLCRWFSRVSRTRQRAHSGAGTVSAGELSSVPC